MSTVAEHNSPQLPGRVAPGDRFSLDGFTGRGYDRGRGVPMQILWLMSRMALESTR